ncbi:MAG: hypothetical protein M1455_09625 [Actinobacteria bacterium]|nr:hypothetical protein [Actinomycetota bacterium]
MNEASQQPEANAEGFPVVFDTIREVMRRFSDAASVNAVYGEPVTHGDNLIIPCAEIVYGMGFGMGGGMGTGPGGKKNEMSTAGGEGNKPEGEAAAHGGEAAPEGAGSGGGGGGKAFSRPVAVVIASPEGVRIEPVVDKTKIVLAALTASGFMLGMVIKMAKGGRARG